MEMQKDKRVLLQDGVGGRVEAWQADQGEGQGAQALILLDDGKRLWVPVNRVVDGPVVPRQEGDTLILSVLEEVLVVERRLVLKEEVRVVRTRVTEPATQRVTLRREEIVVERDGDADAGRPSLPH